MIPIVTHPHPNLLPYLPVSLDKNDIRTIEELLGHKDVTTPMIFTHVLNRGGTGARGPVDLP